MTSVAGVRLLASSYSNCRTSGRHLTEALDEMTENFDGPIEAIARS